MSLLFAPSTPAPPPPSISVVCMCPECSRRMRSDPACGKCQRTPLPSADEALPPSIKAARAMREEDWRRLRAEALAAQPSPRPDACRTLHFDGQ